MRSRMRRGGPSSRSTSPSIRRRARTPRVRSCSPAPLDAPACIFARDLGKDEVAAGQPLVGAGGRLVRAGVYEAVEGAPPPTTDRALESVLGHVLLTNTVPYKPPGNKAYAGAVKERFRPFLAELLGAHWRGDRVITLGTEAFQWFAPYANPGAFEAFWGRDDRYEATLECVLTADAAGEADPQAIDAPPPAPPFPVESAVVQAVPRAPRPTPRGRGPVVRTGPLIVARPAPGTGAGRTPNPRSLGLPIAKGRGSLRVEERPFSLLIRVELTGMNKQHPAGPTGVGPGFHPRRSFARSGAGTHGSGSRRARGSRINDGESR